MTTNMIEVPSDSRRVVVVGDFPGFTPAELFEHWIDPELVARWWAPSALAEASVGGRYRFEWPEMDWVLEGRYTAIEAAKHLGFTWRWHHEAEQDAELHVDVFFAPLAEGSRMSIFHGEFADPEKRQGILEGWLHFGMRLAALRNRGDVEDRPMPDYTDSPSGRP
jgi:uncharacterized protein YndB with AHSA1/START domain